eukprot:CAMPEP_0185576676 /NCGR_PEP_ID=MMETSP0434-20130131/7549_1 /TAXON_ID=626734 ORGANISM="Favella taraikaensis, Strain Fe Narragansett Bay" /NCGR_SAMPLE_ID=MMETSP0434 /ASSEMBLY_ACC=CAM_ASM_000379 /LENGTH=68 /DNA_ID=CAMNT_0028193965 /DNA_START=617 /DNA_END=823 /DNA_ORIENTATION=-
MALSLQKPACSSSLMLSRDTSIDDSSLFFNAAVCSSSSMSIPEPDLEPGLLPDALFLSPAPSSAFSTV